MKKCVTIIVYKIEYLRLRSRVLHQFKTYQISHLNKLSPDLLSVGLTPVGESITYNAGQYLEILCPDGKWMPFSVSNSPQDDAKKELIIRLSTDISSLKSLLNQSGIGALLQVRGPFGAYRLSSNRPLLMLAGGTGIAPIKAMIETVGVENDIHLFWGVRHSSELFLSDTINAWMERRIIKDFTPVVSRESDETWSGAKGWVHESVISQYPDLTGVDIYASGPMGMIKGAVELYPKYGLELTRFYSDMLPFLTT